MPEIIGGAEVKVGALIVGDDPGEDRVLVEVVVGPPRNGVEEHEVLKVGDLASLPLGGHIGGSVVVVKNQVQYGKKYLPSYKLYSLSAHCPLSIYDRVGTGTGSGTLLYQIFLLFEKGRILERALEHL